MRNSQDNYQSLDVRLPSGETVRLGDVVNLAPVVGDPICEKRAVVVRMLSEYNQVMLLTLGGKRLTADLDEISIPPQDVPSQDMHGGGIRRVHPMEPAVPLPSGDVVTVGARVALAPEASTADCGHMAVVETVDRGGLTVLTTQGCRLSVYPYEVKVPDWEMPGNL